MACNVVMIGGGSVLWTECFAVDFFLKESLRGSRLILVDVDVEARELLARLCRRINEELHAGWTIETADTDAALAEAEYVVVSISTGGLDAFDRDYRIPENYGVFHTVGDTVGPAGISRTLRNVPVFVDLAQRMERLCPQAWMIHVTNPLAQLTRCVARTSSVKVVGLCHNFEGTMRALATRIGEPRDDLEADTFGVNHFTWLRDATCRGAPCTDRIAASAPVSGASARTGTTDDAIRAMTGGDESDDRLSQFLYEWFGFIPVGGAEHMAENFPYFLNDPETIRHYRIHRKGVLPNRREGMQTKRRRVERIVAGDEELGALTASHESLADIVESLHTGQPGQAVVNLPNVGQLPNVAADVVVETWADVAKNRITPRVGEPVPDVLKGFLGSIIAEEELAVEAALVGDRKKVVEAMFASPLLHKKDAAEALADELLAAQSQYLPQFNS